MPAEHYIIGDVIGKGSYGEVMLATHKKDKKKYVIKKIDLHNANSKERTFAQQEVEILSKLRHPNIVSYKESYQLDDGCLSIIMGYCEGGDLYTKLKKQAKQNEFLEETQVVEWFVQIAMALQYIHDRNILHRDLKTQNIFLTKSKIIKLGDLGIARVLENNADMATTMIGTPYYMSPELFSNKPYNHKSDVWALGCCVYEMATLKHAFNAKDMNSLVYKILKGKMPSMPKHYTIDLLDIIKSMLSYDPCNRPSASRILRHPFIKKHIALFLEGTKTRQKSKSRTEKQPRRVTATKTSSPVCNISNDINSEAIATASKIDIVVLEQSPDDHCKPVHEVSLSIDKETNGHAAEVHTPERKHSKSEKLERLEFDSQKSHPKTSKNEKILRRRVQDKARLKDEKPSSVSKQQQHQSNNKYGGEAERVSSASSQEDQSEKHSRKLSRDKISKRNHERVRRPLPKRPIDLSEESPVLPRPRFKESTEYEQKHALGINSVDQKFEAQPKISSGVPNMAARKKRRQRQQESQQSQFSPPSLAKKDSQTALSCPSFQRKSKEDIIKEHLKRKSITHIDVVDALPPVVSSQPSFDESECDEASSHGKGSDVMNLIDTLQATLKLDNNTKDRESPESETEIKNHGDVGQSASGRLKNRINRLRRECIQGVGAAVMERAYQIIDQHTEEESEDLLVKLMGREKFNAYNGLIWQLKFCEEFNI